MRALAITGIETVLMMPSTMSGSLIRETPPWARMSAGTRSSAITATAPASSAIFACSGVTTSMMTPPLSISAMPRLTRAVPIVCSLLTPSIVRRGQPGGIWDNERGVIDLEVAGPRRAPRQVEQTHDPPTAYDQRVPHGVIVKPPSEPGAGHRIDECHRVRRRAQCRLAGGGVLDRYAQRPHQLVLQLLA